MKCAGIWLITGFAIMAGVSGCAEGTRYKVLSFFFDGVPGPQAEQAGQNVKRKDSTSTTKTEQYRYGEHGPYAAKLCESCHQRGTNKLIMPLEQLCLNCHELKFGKKKIHGPLTSGDCTVCHDAHSSPNRYLLVSDSKEFCFYCHDKNEIQKRDVHREIQAECTVCHDAHASANEFLLK